MLTQQGENELLTHVLYFVANKGFVLEAAEEVLPKIRPHHNGSKIGEAIKILIAAYPEEAHMTFPVICDFSAAQKIEDKHLISHEFVLGVVIGLFEAAIWLEEEGNGVGQVFLDQLPERIAAITFNDCWVMGRVDTFLRTDKDCKMFDGIISRLIKKYVSETESGHHLMRGFIKHIPEDFEGASGRLGKILAEHILFKHLSSVILNEKIRIFRTSISD